MSKDMKTLAERLRADTVDYDGSQMDNREPPLGALTCRELREAAEALEADAEDAARYRWLRENHRYAGWDQHRLDWYLPRQFRELPLKEQLDAAIDAARSKPAGGE